MDNCKHFDWAIIGAGPAGIAAIGKLIDNGIDPNSVENKESVDNKELLDKLSLLINV